MPICATCRWFDPDYVPVEICEDPMDAIGLCNYPRDRLPLSDQDVPSERRAVGPHESGCPVHQGKPVSLPATVSPALS